MNFCEIHNKYFEFPLATKQYTVLFLPNSQVNLEPRVSCASHNSLPRTKNKKRQKELGLNVQALFHNPSECNKLHPPSHLSVRSVLLHFVQRSPPETRTLCKGGKKVYLIPGSSKSVSFLGRGEMNGVFIINFVKFIQTRNFFRRGAL